MKYSIRTLEKNEAEVLNDFLYEAIFIPEGAAAPPREIIFQPQLQVYVEGFGSREGDLGFVAQTEEGIVGAVWVRVMHDYGHLDDETPSLAISLLKSYRGQGIGTELMKTILAQLKMRGYAKVSLSVQKQNYAVKMYRAVGFETVAENEEEYIMVCPLQ